MVLGSSRHEEVTAIADHTRGASRITGEPDVTAAHRVITFSACTNLASLVSTPPSRGTSQLLVVISIHRDV